MTASEKISQTVKDISDFVHNHPGWTAIGTFCVLYIGGSIYFRRDKPLLKDENE